MSNYFPSFSELYTMSNLTKLEFIAPDILGKNNLSWVIDVEII